MYVYICITIYIYIYRHTERKRERDCVLTNFALPTILLNETFKLLIIHALSTTV